MNKICLIDDDTICNFLHEQIIKDSGLAEGITVFDKPAVAIRHLRQLAESNPQMFPDVIFLDLCMPFMNGWDCLEELKTFPEVFKTCRVFILSSSIDPNDQEKANGYSIVAGFIPKPLKAGILAEIMPNPNQKMCA